MVAHKIISLALVAALLSGTSAPAQSVNEDGAVLRLKLPSRIILTGNTGTTDPEEECGVAGMPPCGGTNNEPLDLRLPTDFRNWATVGDSFGALDITGGTPPYVLSLAGGVLPSGLLPSGSGVDGFYGEKGLYTFKLRATDSATPATQDDTDTIQVEVADPLFLADYGSAVYQGTVGVSWSLPAPELLGGTPGYVYSATGASVDATTGVVSTTPADTGQTQIILTATDVHGRSDSTQPITLNVSNPLTAGYPPANLALRVGASANVAAPAVAGGRGTNTFSQGTGYPAGLAINPSTGVLTGTPTTAGTGTLVTGVSDIDGRLASASANWTVSSQPFAVTGVSPTYEATAGVPFALSPSTTGQIGQVTWSVTGQLPSGLSLNATTGAISGTPTTIETKSGLQLHAADSAGTAQSGNFSINVGGEYTATIAANATNVNVATLFTTAQWQSSTIAKRVIIPAGVTVYSAGAGSPALNTGAGRGSSLTIEVRGNIYGAAGAGAAKSANGGSGQNGGNGGSAIQVAQSGVTVENFGKVWGGAGGGASGGQGGNGQYGTVGTSFTAEQYTTSPTKYYCRYSATATLHYEIWWNGVKKFSSATAWATPQVSGDGLNAYKCGGTVRQSGDPTLWGVLQTTASTVSTTGGYGGAGGRGAYFDGTQVVAYEQGVAGDVGGTNAGTGGYGGRGGNIGEAAAAGSIGAMGNAASGANGYSAGTSGLAGYSVDAGSYSYAFTNNGGTRKGR